MGRVVPLFLIVLLIASICRGDNPTTATHQESGEHPPAAASPWLTGGWVPGDCVETSLPEFVSDDGFHVYGSTIKQDNPKALRYCFGAESDCREAKATWSEGVNAPRENGKKASAYKISMQDGKTTLLTVEATAKDGSICYQTIALGRVGHQGYLHLIEDKETHFATWKPPKLPAPKPEELTPLSPEDKAKLAAMNAERARFGFPAISDDPETRAKFKREAVQGIKLMNDERKKYVAGQRAANPGANIPDLAELQYDFILSASADTNSRLQAYWSGQGQFKPHAYTVNGGQVWAGGGHRDAAASIYTWVHNDAQWGWAHRAIVLGNYSKAGWGGPSENFTADFK